MRHVLVLIALLPLAACSSSRDASRGPGYAIYDGEDGVTIAVEEGASGETLMAALMAAADRIPWTPPETAGGLSQESDQDLQTGGHMYRYRLDGGRLDVFVYRLDMGVDEQIEQTRRSLDGLVERGRIDSFSFEGRSTAEIEWEGATETLHRLTMRDVVNGEAWASFLYLLEDGDYWIKMRASYPEGRYTPAELDAMVQALLAESGE